MITMIFIHMCFVLLITILFFVLWSNKLSALINNGLTTDGEMIDNVKLQTYVMKICKATAIISAYKPSHAQLYDIDMPQIS